MKLLQGDGSYQTAEGLVFYAPENHPALPAMLAHAKAAGVPYTHVEGGWFAYARLDGKAIPPHDFTNLSIRVLQERLGGR